MCNVYQLQQKKWQEWRDRLCHKSGLSPAVLLVTADTLETRRDDDEGPKQMTFTRMPTPTGIVPVTVHTVEMRRARNA